jgi:integrative and conjugative element protein (TIGR02256 family)
MVTLWWRRGTDVTGVLGRFEDLEQRVELTADVLTHVRGHRQTSLRATEAGGQLFGSITPALIRVSRATGPYPADERSRYRYRSNPNAAQVAIQKQSQVGLLYLGEWHTHAEDHPDASGMDDEAMRLLLAKSQLNSNALLMLIVGRKTTVESLALWTVALHQVYQWTLE